MRELNKNVKLVLGFNGFNSLSSSLCQVFFFERKGREEKREKERKEKREEKREDERERRRERRRK